MTRALETAMGRAIDCWVWQYITLLLDCINIYGNILLVLQNYSLGEARVAYGVYSIAKRYMMVGAINNISNLILLYEQI